MINFFGFGAVDPIDNLRQRSTVFLALEFFQQWVIFIGIFIPGVVEESYELIIFLIPERIIGMAVTLRAGEGCAHQRFPGGVHAVEYGGSAEFLIVGSSLIVGHRVAVEGGGEKLVVGRVGEEVAGQLFRNKLIIRFIVVERLNQPITISPNAPDIIPFIAFGVGITGEVHPWSGPTFTIVR